MYNEKKAKQLAKALKKSVKKTMKEDVGHIDVMEEFWTGLVELLCCEFCPCNQSSCNDDCGNILRSWYKELKE